MHQTAPCLLELLAGGVHVFVAPCVADADLPSGLSG